SSDLTTPWELTPMTRYKFVLLALTLGALLTWRFLPLSDLDAQETSLGRLPADAGDSGLAVSPDGKHVAVIETHGSGQVVAVDGVAWKKRYAWVVGVWFSPDGNRVGCVAEDGGKQFVVLDGAEGPRYERITCRGPLFSRNSRHVAYEAERGGKRF